MNKKSSQFVLIGLACLLLGSILIFQVYDVPPLYPDSHPGEIKAAQSVQPKPPVMVNLNTASAEELMTLEGIGAVKADAIIQYREESGGFSTISEVMNVKGVGESTFEQISPYLTTGF